MARYYEENALIEFVKQYTPTINGETTIKCVERAIHNAPTADVVPRSEYDEVLSNWQKIHDSYTTDCIDHYNKGRQEVAREIFEEIRDCRIVSSHSACGFLIYDVYNIEKKYIEKKECPDCKHFVGCEKAVWVGACEEYEVAKK